MWQTNTSEERGRLAHAGTLDYFLLPTHLSHTLAHEDPQTPSVGRWISTYSPIWAWSHLARKFSSSKLAMSVTWACGITGEMQLSQWYLSHWECELGAVCMDLKVKHLPSGWKYIAVCTGAKRKGKGEGKLVRKRRPLILVPARCCPLPPGSLMAVHVDAAFQGPLCPGCRTCMVVPFSFLWMETMDWQGSGVPHGCVQLCMKWKELSFLSTHLKQLTNRNRK